MNWAAAFLISNRLVFSYYSNITQLTVLFFATLQLKADSFLKKRKVQYWERRLAAFYLGLNNQDPSNVNHLPLILNTFYWAVCMNIKIIIGIINSSLLASLLCFMLTIFLWILRQHLLLQSEQIGCQYTFPTSFLFCCYFNQDTNYSTSPTHLIFNLLKYFFFGNPQYIFDGPQCIGCQSQYNQPVFR